MVVLQHPPSINEGYTMKGMSLLGLLIAFSSACSTVPRDIRLPDPPKGHIGISAIVRASVRAVVPVYVTIKNATEETYFLRASQVFTIDSAGREHAPIPPEEVADQRNEGDVAGTETIGEQEDRRASLAGILLGAGVGGVLGTITGGVLGAFVGSAVGASSAEGSRHEPPDSPSPETRNQILSISLRDQTVGPGSLAQGYVYFSKGEHQRVRVLLIAHDEMKESKELFAEITQWPEPPLGFTVRN
jgi:hypothetical protein